MLPVAVASVSIPASSPAVAGQGQQTVAGQGQQAVAGRDRQVVAGRGRQAVARRGTSGGSRFALVDALNAEWHGMADDRRLAAYVRAEIARWADHLEALRPCVDGAQVLTAIAVEPDVILAALIAVHQGAEGRVTGESASMAGPPAPGVTSRELAGRIVLQSMLGKLVMMARRDARHSIEDYVGQLWARIGSYPLDRRPRRIAANLALDTLKAVTRDRTGQLGNGRIVPVTEPDLERAGLAATASGLLAGVEDLSAHRVLRAAEDLGLIDEPTRRLLATVYVEGLSSRAAADRFNITATTVRFRCSRAVRTLAAHARTIADAA